MVVHYAVTGNLACGHHGSNLSSTTELNRVKCRSCRGTDVYKEARKTQYNTARRLARKAKTAHASSNWRASWLNKLTEMPGLQRLPRGFIGQPFV